MSLTEIKSEISTSKGEPSNSFSPAQVRNYKDALLALGVDEASAEKHARYISDPVAREERCTGPNCKVDVKAVKDAVRTVFGGSRPVTLFTRNR